MAYATINQRDVLSALLSVPRTGAWRLDAAVDAETAIGLTGEVVLVLDEGASTWRGWAFRTGENFGKVELRVIGGAGGLARELAGQSYRQATARAIATDILGAAGEALDGSSQADVLDQLLPFWTRRAGRCARQLEQLLGAFGATWRVLPSGKVWVGTETWPDAPAFDADVLSVDPREGRAELAGTQAYKLLPWQTYAGRHLARVEHRMMPDALRTSVWFEDT